MAQNERCYSCGKRIPPARGIRERIYCNDACRQKAYRLRAKLNAEPFPIHEARAMWERQGYSDLFISRLTKLCQEQTDPQFLFRLEQVLYLHERWLESRKRREKRNAKRNDL